MPTMGSYHGIPYPVSADSFTHTTMNPGAFWEEEGALEYLASSNGFAQDLRNFIPQFSHYYSPHNGPFAIQPPRPPELTSHPSHAPPQQLSPSFSPAGYRSVPDEFFQQFAASSMSDERGREVAGHMADSSRFMAAQMARTTFFSHDPSRMPHAPSYSMTEPSPVRREPPAPVPGRSVIMLILSRATAESIKALVEHKKECPACQLELEPDNFMAVITCCDTAMHATCLSAWVNSQTYSKSKTCMKCRRSIDARRLLNNVVPPVSDKNWDEGAELNAPESLKGDAKIELNVSAKPDRGHYNRRMRNAYSSYRSRPANLPLPDQLSPDARRAIVRLRQEQVAEFDAFKRRIRSAYMTSSKASEDEILANRRLSDARAEVSRGTVLDLNIFQRRYEETKLAKEKATDEYKSLQRELELLQRSHTHRLNALIHEAMTERCHARAPEDERPRTLPPSVEGSGSGLAMSTSP